MMPFLRTPLILWRCSRGSVALRWVRLAATDTELCSIEMGETTSNRYRSEPTYNQPRQTSCNERGQNRWFTKIEKKKNTHPNTQVYCYIYGIVMPTIKLSACLICFPCACTYIHRQYSDAMFFSHNSNSHFQDNRDCHFERCLGHAGCNGFPTLVFFKESWPAMRLNTPSGAHTRTHTRAHTQL